MKMKNLIAQKVDAIGYLYRKGGTQTIVSFKTDERDLATGARPAHLAGKEFVLVEETEKGSRKFNYGWDQIFLK